MFSFPPEPVILHPEEKLNKSNWANWLFYMQAAALLTGVFGYLDGTITMPTEAQSATRQPTAWWGSPDPTLVEWQQRNDYALGLIFLNVGNPEELLGMGADLQGTAHQVWVRLEARGRGNTASQMAVLNAEQELMNARYIEDEDESLQEYLARLRGLWRAALNAGANVSRERFKVILLRSLSLRGQQFVPLLLDQELEDVIARLESYGALRQRGGAVSSANSSNHDLEGLGLTTERARAREVCANPKCRRVGHMIDTCYREGGGMEGQYPSWWRHSPGWRPDSSGFHRPYYH